ncbi:MAG: hypothetical protein BroJett040_10420 [Oligoflexia bacterium]|nr:MAG: hypothetical protein BroJett040_10420 [Oligoflexia bacterium]
MGELQCPNCGKKVEELQAIDSALAAKIAESGIAQSVPPQVCMSCFTQLAGSIGRGSILLAKEKAKEQKKLMLWKSRVNLIKKARQCMTEKAFSDAAVQYEKYIKVLEMVFEAKPGELSPEMFKDSARTQELTVVASVYWDLLRIYDTSEKYGERQALAAKKLTQFLRFTPIYPDILRKAESFSKSARNPAVFKQFLKMASDSKGRCFIATAAFDNPFAQEVLILQDWRDRTLEKTPMGCLFVKLYYRFSPPIAALMDRLPFLKAPIRTALRLFIDRALRQ